MTRPLSQPPSPRSPSRLAARLVAAWLLVASLAPGAAADDPFAAQGPPAGVAQQTGFEQRWGQYNDADVNKGPPVPGRLPGEATWSAWPWSRTCRA